MESKAYKVYCSISVFDPAMQITHTLLARFTIHGFNCLLDASVDKFMLPEKLEAAITKLIADRDSGKLRDLKLSAEMTVLKKEDGTYEILS